MCNNICDIDKMIGKTFVSVEVKENPSWIRDTNKKKKPTFNRNTSGQKKKKDK